MRIVTDPKEVSVGTRAAFLSENDMARCVGGRGLLAAVLAAQRRFLGP